MKDRLKRVRLRGVFKVINAGRRQVEHDRGDSAEQNEFLPGDAQRAPKARGRAVVCDQFQNARGAQQPKRAQRAQIHAGRRKVKGQNRGEVYQPVKTENEFRLALGGDDAQRVFGGECGDDDDFHDMQRAPRGFRQVRQGFNGKRNQRDDDQYLHGQRECAPGAAVGFVAGAVNDFSQGRGGHLGGAGVDHFLREGFAREPNISASARVFINMSGNVR